MQSLLQTEVVQCAAPHEYSHENRYTSSPMCFRRQHCSFHSLLQWEAGRQAWKRAQFWCQCEEQAPEVTVHDCHLQQLIVSENAGHLQQLIWNAYCTRNSCKDTEINLASIFLSVTAVLTLIKQKQGSCCHLKKWWTEKCNLYFAAWPDPTGAQWFLSQALCSAIHSFCCLAELLVWGKTTNWAGFAQHTTAILPCPQIHY